MNAWFNCDQAPDDFVNLPNRYRIIRRHSDMTDPAPAGTYAFIEERSDSINDGFFVVVMGKREASAELVNYPAIYHSGISNVAFADGHAEAHKWHDPRTTPPFVKGVHLLDQVTPNNPDVAWLQDRTTGLK